MARLALQARGRLPWAAEHSNRPGPQPQPEFINAVAGLLTQLAPIELLDELRFGRAGGDRERGAVHGHGEALLHQIRTLGE